MDSINLNRSDYSKTASNIPSSSSHPVSNKSKSPNFTSGVEHSLPDHSDLIHRAQNAEPDVRPDKVSRAMQLLSDPNWINNKTLDQLSAKLIDQELS